MTRKEWERELPVSLAIGQDHDWFYANNTHIHVRQLTENLRQWYLRDYVDGHWIQDSWVQQQEDPLRVAVDEAVEMDARKRGRDFILQSSLIEMDVHGGEQ